MADLKIEASLNRPEFAALFGANLLAGMAMYVLLLAEPWVLGRVFHENLSVSGTVVSVFGAGLFLFGPFANYWLDTYKRKSVVLRALLYMLVFTVVTLYQLPEWIYIVARFMQGAAYGLLQIALGSTLLIDLSHNKKRTDAAHIYYWFSRFALALGPFLALLVRGHFELNIIIWVACGLILGAWLLIFQLHVPFRSPLEPKIISTDRFWLGRARILFFTLLPITFVIGMLFPRNYSLDFYGCMLLGFVMACMAHYLFFKKRDSRLIMVIGFLALLALYGINYMVPDPNVVPFTGILAGLGCGLTTNRYLLYFIRVAEHCERGTGQTTYVLAWESGLCLGVLCSSLLLPVSPQMMYLVGIAVVVVSALCYLLFVHRWVLKHSRKGM